VKTKNGTVEYWNDGMVKYGKWKIGMMEIVEFWGNQAHIPFLRF
jgi:hypothetical protein